MADQTDALAGIVNFYIDGTNYLVAGDAKYQVSGIENETLTGQDTVHGRKSKPRAGSISLSLRDTGDIRMSDIQAIVSSTIVLDLSNGKTIVGSGMWNVGEQEVDTAEGTAEIKFEGPSVVEA